MSADVPAGAGAGAALPPSPPPPPPAAACPPDVEARFAAFLAATRSGHSLTAQLRAHRDFGNPYHLEEVISTYGIDDKGTGYPARLWDPLALPVEGHADVLDARQAQQEEARRQRQAARTAVAFSARGALETTGLGGGGVRPFGTQAP